VWGAIEVSRVKGGGGFLDANSVATVTRGGSGSSASITVTSGTLRDNNELVVAMLSLAGGGADAGIDTPTNCTAITQFNDFDGVHAGHGAYRTAASRAAQSATWTNDTTTAPYAAIIAAFRAVGAQSVSGSAPVNTVAPAITGTPTEDETLTCSTGTWSGSPDSYTYQWKDDGVAISAATGSTYVLTASEVGATITCTVTATNEVGSTSATATGVGPVDSASVSAVDDLSTAPSGAWSVYRRLRTDYTGNLIRIRRTSDDTETNIGYDGSNVLDTAAITTFVGAGDAYITTIYDQSGNGYNLTETRSANQPFIMQAGVLFTAINSKPGISADGSDDMMQSTTDADTIVPVGANALFAIARPTAGSDKTLDTIYEARAIAGGNPDGVWAFAAIDQNAGTDQAMFYSYDGIQTGAGVNAPELPYTAVFAMVKTASAVKGYINGGAGASAARGTRSTAAGNKFTLFKHWSSSQHWQGQFIEIITFASEPSLADQNALGADMAAIAGTTWTTIT
jgi:hypothetical protein